MRRHAAASTVARRGAPLLASSRVVASGVAATAAGSARFVAARAVATDAALECGGSRGQPGTGLPTRGGHGAPLRHGRGGRGIDGREASFSGR